MSPAGPDLGRSVPDPELAGPLADGLRAAWRAVVAATRAAEGLPALPDSQVAVVRRLVDDGPTTPAALADALQLARSTVSNLVRELVAGGLVERHPSASDGRSVQLVPTARARHVVQAFGRGRVDAVARALEELDPAGRKHLADALPALKQLTDRLREVDGPPSRPDIA